LWDNRACQIYRKIGTLPNRLNHAHENLENPSHSWPLRWFIELIGYRLSLFLEFLSEPPFGERVNEKTKNHNHA
jgi:hypothetical protein